MRTTICSCVLPRSVDSLRSREESVDSLARRTGFSGVVRVDRAAGIELVKAYGFADRAHGTANTADTVFAIASGAKGLTALSVVGLIEDGSLALDTTARSVLGDDLPLIQAMSRSNTCCRIDRGSATTSTRTPVTRSPTT